ncbi:hypothetical protein M8C21_014135, partial [Ambrosia artemisiifolia]
SSFESFAIISTLASEQQLVKKESPGTKRPNLALSNAITNVTVKFAASAWIRKLGWLLSLQVAMKVTHDEGLKKEATEVAPELIMK